MRTISYFITVSIFIFSSCAGHKSLLSTDFGNGLHSPAQILKIMIDSRVSYAIDSLRTAISDTVLKTPVLSNQMYLMEKDSTRQLAVYALDEAAKTVFNRAENSFREKDYTTALTLYKKVYRMDPEYAYALTLLGDVFFNRQNYDSAAYYFQKAIAQNPIDYSARWFLADTYWQQGRGLEALEQITMAHLLNRGKKTLFQSLKYYRKQVGQPWSDWAFVPQYKLSKDGHTVSVKSRDGYWGYAMVKALWRYEPGYSQTMIGLPPSDYEFSLLQEAEAINMLITGDKKPTRLKKIINDGYFKAFYYYEIVSRKTPQALLMLLPAELQRIVDYLARFH